MSLVYYSIVHSGKFHYPDGGKVHYPDGGKFHYPDGGKVHYRKVNTPVLISR
jgi:hypothetical protein